MSTRSQIAIYENEDAPILPMEASLYRHSDGDPESVMPEITPFLKEFNKVRGIADTADCLARLTQHLTNLSNKFRAMSFVGYGILPKLAGNIAYFYHVSPTAIKVFSCSDEDTNKWKLVKRVALKPKAIPSSMEYIPGARLWKLV